MGRWFVPVQELCDTIPSQYRSWAAGRDFARTPIVVNPTAIASPRRISPQQASQDVRVRTRQCGYPLIVGDGAQVAEELIRWIDESGADGFNLTRTVVPESYEAFKEHVIPELQSRGAYKTAYLQGTLRDKLLGNGDHLAPGHYGYQFR
ncbi:MULTISPECIES: hypothetical protein [Rhizobium]|uniref:hypothetical protein n=1 Tax=Rhizobium TaxID=379 RepID=UPI0028AE154D